MWARAFAFVLLTALASRADEPAPTVLADFETGEPADGWSFRNLEVAEIATPHGRGLKLVGRRETTELPYGTLQRAVDVHDWRTFRAFSMRVRVEAQAPIHLRFQAIRGKGPGRLLCQFTVAPGDWLDVVLDLKDFRDDGADQAGSFAQVDRILLRWDAGAGAVSIDDLRLLPGDRGALSCTPTVDDWRRLGFGDAKARVREGKHFTLLDDVPVLEDADAQRLLDRLEDGLNLLADRYGVTGELGDKVPFFLFASRTEFEEFVPRLGTHFGATVAPPKSDGLSVFGVGMSSYDPKQGWDRPVFVHEALHGAIHRLLGVGSNGNWIQEGLASAVQSRLYPASLDRARLAHRFEKRSADPPTGSNWSAVLSFARTPMSAYAEALSIMDFLAEKKRDALPKVWDAVGALREPVHVAAPAAIASALGTTQPALEDEWLAWGAAYYGAKSR